MHFLEIRLGKLFLNVFFDFDSYNARHRLIKVGVA